MICEKKRLYNKAAKEVYIIITYMSEELQSKIPDNVKEVLIENMDKNYFFEYNMKLSLDEQNLMPETRGLLSIIYSNYLCNEEEKQKWNEYDRFVRRKAEEIKSTKFEYKGFKKKEEFDIQETKFEMENALIEVKKKNIFQKIIKFLKSIKW